MENILLSKTNLLVLLTGDHAIAKDPELVELAKLFCGSVIRTQEDIDTAVTIANEAGREIDIFFAGDLSPAHQALLTSLRSRLTCFGNQPIVFSVINEKVINGEDIEALSPYASVSMGQVPINVYNVGVYYRDLFGPDGTDYFTTLETEHKFQVLTDSNKPSSAYRKGIYLSEVVETREGPQFHVLRCSTNLDGPTEGFTNTDRHIVNTINNCAFRYFQEKTDLNHVLAQIYYNNADTEKKAKIKEHSDKTKDMPYNGLMAFCTFYDPNSIHINGKMRQQGYDIVFNETSTALTKMRFRLKEDVPNEIAISSPKQFDVVLYPNSVFMMSLSANRYYTHAIVPSALPAGIIPTRLGYVIRCSCTPALFNDREQKTYLLMQSRRGVERYPLQSNPSRDDIQLLKDLYFLENTTSQPINYEAINLHFSLNSGDYLRPVIPGQTMISSKGTTDQGCNIDIVKEVEGRESEDCANNL